MVDNIHFRCTFDIRPAAGSQTGFSSLVEEIARWIWSKDSTLDLKPAWLLSEGSTRRPDGRAAVTVDSIPSGTGGFAPDVWALRYEHQDSEFSQRRWFIDFGIASTAANAWRLSTVVGNSLHASYLGKEPGHLPATSPRVIKDLVGSDKWLCEAGSSRLSARPLIVEVGRADRLSRAIEDKNRACPLVYVSLNRVTGEPMIDPGRLAGMIVGAGVVYVAQSPEVDEELEFLLVPREFRAPNGTVRVYAPGADFNLIWQSYRHRYFTRSQIEDLTASEVEGQIARSLTRRQGWASVRSSVTSIDDVSARRRELRRAALQDKADTASKDELLKLFEEDNSRLSEALAVLSKEKEAAELALDERQTQMEEVRDALRKTEYGSDSFRAEAVDAKRQLATLREAAEAARGIRQLPSSLSDVINLIERLHGPQIVFTLRAKESAAEASFEDVAVAWECLFAVATVLPGLAFSGDGSALAQRFTDQTGFELSMTEGKQTKKDPKLLELRKLTHDGIEWDISAHIKHGNKAPKLLRVHFALDRDRKIVIVGHCGDHLDTAGTQRRK